MQAIQTKYIGPTNTRGSRVKAFSEAFPRGVTVSWDHALNSEQNHDAACIAFIDSKDWHGLWARGASADSKGNVYVCLRRQFDGREMRTPHPASVDACNYLVVNPKEGA